MIERWAGRVAALACAIVLAAPGPAGGVTLAKVITTTGGGFLCARASCPSVAVSGVAPGSLIPVYEFKGDYARIGGPIPLAEAMSRYPSVDPRRIPNDAALWVPRASLDLGPSAPPPEPPQPEEARQSQAGAEKPDRQPVSLPRGLGAPIPEPAPRQIAALPAQPATLPEANAALSPGDTPAHAEDPGVAGGAALARTLGAAEGDDAAPAPAPEPSAETASGKPAPGGTEPQAETAAEAGAQIALAPERPTSLDGKLLDKRLSRLPARPGDGYSLEQVIALRHEALQILERGECTGISQGGKTAMPGFLFLICEGEDIYRQFAE